MDYYVYVHRKASNGEVFYVGKGKNNRAWTTGGRTDYWHRVVKKYGLIVELVMSGLQEWYAFELETDLISMYGRRDLGHGSLVNMSDGGEGASGVLKSDEVRLKMSKSRMGIIFSEEHLRNMSRVRLGKRLPDSTRAKMSAYRKGRSHNETWRKNQELGAQRASGKKIKRQDGVVFNSLLEAARGVCDDPSKYASIASSLGALLNGKRKEQIVCGYTWCSV